MDWRDRIVTDPEVLGGKPVIRGTRISVEKVVELLADGYSKEQVLEQYDHLTIKDIEASLVYAREILRIL